MGQDYFNESTFFDGIPTMEFGSLNFDAVEVEEKEEEKSTDLVNTLETY